MSRPSPAFPPISRRGAVRRLVVLDGGSRAGRRSRSPHGGRRSLARPRRPPPGTASGHRARLPRHAFRPPVHTPDASLRADPRVHSSPSGPSAPALRLALSMPLSAVRSTDADPPDPDPARSRPARSRQAPRKRKRCSSRPRSRTETRCPRACGCCGRAHGAGNRSDETAAGARRAHRQPATGRRDAVTSTGVAFARPRRRHAGERDDRLERPDAVQRMRSRSCGKPSMPIASRFADAGPAAGRLGVAVAGPREPRARSVDQAGGDEPGVRRGVAGGRGRVCLSQFVAGRRPRREGGSRAGDAVGHAHATGVVPRAAHRLLATPTPPLSDELPPRRCGDWRSLARCSGARHRVRSDRGVSPRRSDLGARDRGLRRGATSARSSGPATDSSVGFRAALESARSRSRHAPARSARARRRCLWWLGWARFPGRGLERFRGGVPGLHVRVTPRSRTRGSTSGSRASTARTRRCAGGHARGLDADSCDDGVRRPPRRRAACGRSRGCSNGARRRSPRATSTQPSWPSSSPGAYPEEPSEQLEQTSGSSCATGRAPRDRRHQDGRSGAGCGAAVRSLRAQLRAVRACRSRSRRTIPQVINDTRAHGCSYTHQLSSATSDAAEERYVTGRLVARSYERTSAFLPLRTLGRDTARAIRADR
jgi:hypothetical protein